MQECSLFLAFPLSEAFQKKMFKLSKEITDTFIQDTDSLYLRRIEHDGNYYLGKWINSPTDMQTLEAMQFNIYSLLRKIDPDSINERVPLQLLALPIEK